MELHVQRCQSCNSINMKNILVRENGASDRVYVQCQDCKSFVASYEIAPMGYFHNGKGYESFLRGIVRSGEITSSRNLQSLFETRRQKELNKYDEVIQKLEERDAQRNAGSGDWEGL